MRKNCIITMLLWLCFISTKVVASTLSIGGSATQTKTPINFYYTDTYQGCQMIYTADELGDFYGGAEITAISFYYENVSTSASVPQINFSVKMGTTTSSYFASNNNMLSTSGLVEVANTNIGGWAKKSSGWVTIRLSKPFKYTGGNLLIDIRNTEKGNYLNEVYFASSSAGNYKTLSWTSASSATVNSISSGSRTSTRPNIQFTYSLYSELTGESGITYIYCPEPGQFYQLYRTAGSPSKIKVAGFLNGKDFLDLSTYEYYEDSEEFDCCLQHINYLDLSDVTIEAWDCNLNYNNYPQKDYSTEKNKLSFNFKKFYITTLVLPDNCEYFYTEGVEVEDSFYYKVIHNIYTRNRTPFGMTYNYQYGILHVPSGTKKAWEEQLANGINNGNSGNDMNNCIVVDTPVKTLDNSFYLTSTEIANVDILVVNCSLDAPDFKVLNSMPQLNKLTINGSISRYTGSDGPLNEYTIYPANEIPQNAFKDNKVLHTIELGCCNNIGNCAFQNATNLRSFTKKLPYNDHTNIVGDYAFDGCVKLNSVETPGSYWDEEFGFTSIGDFAFRNTRVSSIDISSRCTRYDDEGDVIFDDYYVPFTHIGKNPFFGVYSTHGIKSVYNFNAGADGEKCNLGPFSLDEDCNNWSNARHPGTYLLIKDNTLYASAFTPSWYSNYNNNKYVMSDIYHVADYGISDVYIEEISISSNLKTIGDAFLYKCSNLKSIKGSSSAFVAKDSVLYNKAMDCLIKFPASHASTEFHIPTSVTYIEKWAFEGLKNLKDLYIYNNEPINIGENVFENVDFENFVLHVPRGAKEAYKANERWGEITNIVEMEPEDVVGDVNGDGAVDVADITCVVTMILDENRITDAGDVNGDGEVDVADITRVVAIILGTNNAPTRATAVVEE